MRNLKKVLALVLALVMSLSLVTIANAADFTDADEINYEEAVDVMTTIGVFEGFEDSSFKPAGTLTREQGAKIITYMLLGENADRLSVSSSRYSDVAATRWSAPAIEYCTTLGILTGNGDGTYSPTSQLTGYAFAKMLLTALGYNAETEGFVGAGWTINVTRLATQVGLDDGIETLNWGTGISREEACQMALNAVKSPLVAYEGGNTIIVNGAEVSFGSGDAYYVTTTIAKEQRISEQRLSNSNEYTVEFGERYFPNLRLNSETDDYERPSHTWVYNSTEIGTYVDYETLVESYTEGVDGKTLYELLGKSTIEKYGLTYYVDGAVNNTLVKNHLVRSNTTDVGETGNGVLTQVFVDHDAEEIVITSINTYLAQANADYNKNTETLSLNVYVNDHVGVTKTVDSADVPNAADVVEDQYVLVTMSRKDRAALEVVKISDVEILTDATVTKFSTAGGSDTVESIFTKVTANGTEYEASEKALYDIDALNLYDASLLTDMSYNIYLDQYGYAIGVDLFEGDLNYVFITGYDRGRSYISIKTADAAAIFPNGEMEEITVNVTSTNKNIDKVDGDAVSDSNDPYYREWNLAGAVALNRWYSYSVDANNVYTLKPVEGRMFATDYNFVANPEVTINCANVRLTDTEEGTGRRGFGNDDSVYITVETGEVDMSTRNDDAIVDVTGLYTGVQSVEIEMTAALQGNVGASVYTLMDKDQYIIASIVLGEAKGSTTNYAYILTDAKSEGIQDGYYMWEFDAVLGGEKVTLTARSKYENTIDDLTVGAVQELRFDGDYVTGVDTIANAKFITNYATDWNDHEVYFVNYANNETIELQGRTFKSSGAGDKGLTIISTSMPTVLRQRVNGSWTTTNYSSMSEALAAVGDADTNTAGKQFDGRIIGVFDSLGRLEWAFIESDTPVTTGTGGGYTDDGSDTTLPSTTDLAVMDNSNSGGTNTVSVQGRYDATNGKLYLQFYGLWTDNTNAKDGAAQVDLQNILISDQYGKGQYVNISNLKIQSNGTSYVAEVDYTATTFPTGYFYPNSINVTFVDNNVISNVDSWYVDYSAGSATFAAGAPVTIANSTTAATQFSFTVKKPDGVATYSIDDGGTTNVTAVTPNSFTQANLTADQTFTVSVAANTRPVVDLDVTANQYSVNTTVRSNIYKSNNGIVFAALTSAATQSVNASAAANITMNVNTADVVTANDRIVVTYIEDGTTKTYTHTCTASALQSITFATDSVTAAKTIEITGVELQVQTTVSGTVAAVGNLGSAATVTVKRADGTALAATGLVPVGETLTVTVTVAAGGVTTTGVNFTLTGATVATQPMDANPTGAATVTFQYVVPVTGANTTVTVANK